jgi:uncharacterized protein YfaP (DUF2135 family)
MLSGKLKQLSVFLLLIFIILSVLLAQDEKNASVKFVIGKTKILPNQKTNWQDAKLNMAIKKGDRIKTYLNARIELEMPDGSIIKINENTIFDIKEIKFDEDKNEDEMSFTLWAGNIWAKFKKIVSTRQKREIESPSAVVAIRGTTLEIDVDQNQTTRVRVSEGQVAVTSKDVGGQVIVRSNQESTVEKGKDPTQPSTFSQPNGDEPEADFVFEVNTAKLQFTDPAVLMAGVSIRGRVTPGYIVAADGNPLNVDQNGNFSGRVKVQEGVNEVSVTAQKDGQSHKKEVKFLVNTKRPELRLSKPIVAGFNNRRDYSLSGAVFDYTPKDRIKVFINDQFVKEVVGRGSFNRTIILNEGKNEIKITAVDISKNKTEIAEHIFLDTMKPIITITQPVKRKKLLLTPPLGPPDQDVSAERFRQQIRGLIIDPEPSSGIKRITINGKEIQPNSDGSFETTIVLKRGENHLSFYAEDLAGNISRDNTRTVLVP